MRYSNTKRNSKKNSLKTTMYINVPERDDDMYFISQPGDRLDLLATRFYGDPGLWWFIANINNLSSINVEPATSLRIPISPKLASGK